MCAYVLARPITLYSSHYWCDVLYQAGSTQSLGRQLELNPAEHKIFENRDYLAILVARDEKLKGQTFYIRVDEMSNDPELLSLHQLWVQDYLQRAWSYHDRAIRLEVALESIWNSINERIYQLSRPKLVVMKAA